MPPDALDLITYLLQYAPQKRFTAMQALAHPFFDELRDPRTRLPNGNPLPELFNFNERGTPWFFFAVVVALLACWCFSCQLDGCLLRKRCSHVGCSRCCCMDGWCAEIAVMSPELLEKLTPDHMRATSMTH